MMRMGTILIMRMTMMKTRMITRITRTRGMTLRQTTLWMVKRQGMMMVKRQGMMVMTMVDMASKI
jgi:hypothetical protein